MPLELVNSYCYYYNLEHTVDTACLVCALGCPRYDSARESLDRCSDRRPRADSCCKGQRLQIATNSTGLGLAPARSIVDIFARALRSTPKPKRPSQHLIRYLGSRYQHAPSYYASSPPRSPQPTEWVDA